MWNLHLLPRVVVATSIASAPARQPPATTNSSMHHRVMLLCLKHIHSQSQAPRVAYRCNKLHPNSGKPSQWQPCIVHSQTSTQSFSPSHLSSYAHPLAPKPKLVTAPLKPSYIDATIVLACPYIAKRPPCRELSFNTTSQCPQLVLYMLQPLTSL